MDLQLVPALFVSSVHPVVAPAEIFHCLTSEARFPWRTSTGLVSETQQKTLNELNKFVPCGKLTTGTERTNSSVSLNFFFPYYLLNKPGPSCSKAD